MSYKLFVDFVDRLLKDLTAAKPVLVEGLQKIKAELKQDGV
jgi:hypothetical protein